METEQIRTAPVGAVFVWPVAASVGYARDLARFLQREDLNIRTPEAFGGNHAWLGKRPVKVVIDHATWGYATFSQIDAMLLVLDRNR